MKRLIFITLILIAATAYITVKYFKNLNTSGTHAGNIIRTIPDNAALVFEFTNEKTFYDIYAGNTLLNNLVGEEKITEMDTLRKVLFGNPALHSFFTGRNVFLSIHPSAANQVELLLTASAAKDIDLTEFDQLAKQKNTGMVITPLKVGEKSGYNIYFSSLKKRFYLLHTDGNIFSGSFSKDLITLHAAYVPHKDKQSFMLLPDQQNSNSLANLYVNYEHLSPLFTQLFKSKDIDVFKPFRILPAQAALNLNFRSDAIMFSGYTNIQRDKPGTYLSVFANQQPVNTQLQDLLPSTTAYALNFAVSNTLRFTADLSDFQQKAGLKGEKDELLKQVKAGTGINLQREFDQLLGSEFAVITTRYQEKIAVITVKNGLALRPFMVNISGMITDDVGQFNYNKLPYFLLGDAFSVFKRPYFKIIDNYLILANSAKEIDSYSDTYLNRKYLSKTDQYININNLQAERSNVSFFIHFKNAQQILRDNLKDEFYSSYKDHIASWKDFYGASFQFAASERNFYTNLCLLQNKPDTIANKKTE